jgi:hypothetical protein
MAQWVKWVISVHCGRFAARAGDPSAQRAAPALPGRRNRDDPARADRGSRTYPGGPHAQHAHRMEHLH